MKALTRMLGLVLCGLLTACGSSAAPLAAAQGPAPAAEQAERQPVDGPVVAPSRPRPDVVQLVAARANTPNPFPRRVPMPAFPRGLEWLNAKPIELKDLRGKFVLLDFWTYCCINCMHVLPELKKLEQAYPNNVVVIGVHSAKFETEKDSENIAQAILRYNIEHPVVNDRNHEFWNMIGVSSWPTLVLIDPEGQVVWARPGEVEFETLDEVMKTALPYYREQKLLDERPLRFELLQYEAERTALRYPGKVLADEAGGRLFIADSNHNRIVITSLDGQLQAIIGSGAEGTADGGYAECQFKQPQGMALHDSILYVADTENHLLRKVDLAAQRVTTIAGTGKQGRLPWPGLDPDKFDLQAARRSTRPWLGKPRGTALNSPWALLVHDKFLYIAMAGPHQIWRMPLSETSIGPYAGNGREDIVDGPLLPDQPYGEGAASFAQPSGLATDGKWLFVADSEGSSIRAVPFTSSGTVRTVVGTAHLPFGRLFEFGDVDGEPGKARLQHCLGVAYHDGLLFVADAYNHKIKVIDPATGVTRTFAGNGKPGSSDQPAQFHEPAGLSYAAGRLYVADTNNHRIRTVRLADGQVGTLEIAGLEPPELEVQKPSFADAEQVKVPAVRLRPENGHVTLAAQVELPAGWKMNADAPQQYWVESRQQGSVIAREALGVHAVDPPAGEFAIRLPVSGLGQDEVTISLVYYYCESQDGICKVGSVVWKLPLEVAQDAQQTSAALQHAVPGLPAIFTR